MFTNIIINHLYIFIALILGFIYYIFKNKTDEILRVTTMSVYTDMLNVIEITLLYYLKENALYEIARNNTELSSDEFEKYMEDATTFIVSMFPIKLKKLIYKTIGEEQFYSYILTEVSTKLSEIFVVVDIEVLED